MPLKKVNTIHELEELLVKHEFGKTPSETIHCGTINHVGRVDKNSFPYEALTWLMESYLPPLKLLTWGQVKEIRKTRTIAPLGNLDGSALNYTSMLPYAYTAPPPMGGPPVGTCHVMHREFDYTDFSRVLPDRLLDAIGKGALTENQLFLSTYYHAAKSHWLINNIREEGLWNPVQARVRKTSSNAMRFQIHPGSVRSMVFEEMENDEFEILAWDFDGMLEDYPSMTADEVCEMWWDRIKKKRAPHKGMSVTYTNGIIEFGTDLGNITFRKEVCKFNKRVYDNAKGKPINIYIGYDSRHSDLPEMCKKTIIEGIRKSAKGGDLAKYVDAVIPEIKFLDVSKIPEYTREYKDQSVEFTYSRFLIPYLEDYSGYSIFVDDDFIFNRSILTPFLYTNPDDAVTCVQYKDFNAEDTKFNGEQNVSYPKKLWSSFMIFNNSHPDCQKLTPEVINTESGKYLHQFEWTDNVGNIPEKYIITEGYDLPEDKPSSIATHYTRGGPWIEGMDTTNIDLRAYHKYINMKVS